jgi:outer membrane protein OmpA-like peptidoglycan-associated protein
MLESCADDVFVLESACADLNQQLKDCQNKPAKVVTNTVVQNNNSLESVRYVFFRVGSSKITSDQQPNVEMIAEYMKNHPESTVVITGYASKDGNLDFNIRLAQARAENVKNMLTKGFGIKPDRIKAEGQGVGSMFQEESWNRVAICVLHEATK